MAENPLLRPGVVAPRQNDLLPGGGMIRPRAAPAANMARYAPRIEAVQSAGIGGVPVDDGADELDRAVALWEANKARAADLASAGQPMRFRDPYGNNYLAGVDTHVDGLGHRLTRIGPDGVPHGHTEFRTLEDAIFDALRSGHEIVPPRR